MLGKKRRKGKVRGNEIIEEREKKKKKRRQVEEGREEGDRREVRDVMRCWGKDGEKK